MVQDAATQAKELLLARLARNTQLPADQRVWHARADAIAELRDTGVQGDLEEAVLQTRAETFAFKGERRPSAVWDMYLNRKRIGRTIRNVTIAGASVAATTYGFIFVHGIERERAVEDDAIGIMETLQISEREIAMITAYAGDERVHEIVRRQLEKEYGRARAQIHSLSLPENLGSTPDSIRSAITRQNAPDIDRTLDKSVRALSQYRATLDRAENIIREDKHLKAAYPQVLQNIDGIATSTKDPSALAYAQELASRVDQAYGQRDFNNFNRAEQQTTWLVELLGQEFDVYAIGASNERNERGHFAIAAEGKSGRRVVTTFADDYRTEGVILERTDRLYLAVDDDTHTRVFKNFKNGNGSDLPIGVKERGKMMPTITLLKGGLLSSDHPITVHYTATRK